YSNTYQRALTEYANREEWTKKSLMNIARSGIFASDNSINNYAKDIWHLTPINYPKK
ncbi:MAG: glycogen/starch/alpha-glucan phosphorylase, partial [Clostridia bacterium]|nr:glycogen/starch/alpha-glucan phosphorylase [Clostridia bacterium]